MFRDIRLAAVALAVAVLTVWSGGPALAADGIHRLALQISDNDPGKMNTVLNVAANVSRFYSEQGQELEVEIVAFNAGLHMLREDTSPVKERLRTFTQSMPNVTFDACGNTIAGMTKKEGKAPPLITAAHVVPAGVVRLIELNEAGWTIVRP